MTTLTLPIFRFFNVDISVTRCAASVSRAPTELETARADLLEQIDQGFTIEGSGIRTEVPNFAKSQLKTLVEVDC